MKESEPEHVGVIALQVLVGLLEPEPKTDRLGGAKPGPVNFMAWIKNQDL